MDFITQLAQLRTPFLTKLFSLLTYLGDGMPVVIIVFIIYWCIDKKLAKAAGLSIAVGGILSGLLKAVFCIPRPWVRDPSFEAVEFAKARAAGYSFPSGHAVTATGVYGSIGMKIKKIAVRILCAVIILLVLFSRLYLGVHTPADVIVGFIVSAVTVALMYWLSPKLEKLSDKKFIIFTVISVIISLLVLVYIRFKPYKDGYEFELFKDAYLACGMSAGIPVGWYLEKRYLDFDVRAVWWMQIIKIAVGLLTSVALLKVLGLVVDLLPSIQALAYYLRYFIITVWAIFVYPYLFTRIKVKK